jgi:hypothetical protein
VKAEQRTQLADLARQVKDSIEAAEMRSAGVQWRRLVRRRSGRSPRFRMCTPGAPALWRQLVLRAAAGARVSRYEERREHLRFLGRLLPVAFAEATAG